MKLIFAGTPANAAQALRLLSQRHEITLVITRKDAVSGRKQELKPSAVSEAANELGLPVLKRNRLTADDLSEIRQSGAELAVVVAYGALVPPALLEEIPWWNLHFSLLPKWRGATPLQHSMLSGGEGSGVTLFELEAGLDTGPIIASESIDIDYSKTCGDLLTDFTSRGIEITESALASRPLAAPQSGKASYAPKISRQEARLDLSEVASKLHHKVMALNPEPMAWLELDGSPLRILRTASVGDTNWDSLDEVHFTPGAVSSGAGKVWLHCARGTRLELLEVQPAGKKPMRAADWFRGLNREVRLD